MLHAVSGDLGSGNINWLGARRFPSKQLASGYICKQGRPRAPLQQDSARQDGDERLRVLFDCVVGSLRLANLRQRASRQPQQYDMTNAMPAVLTCKPCSL